MSRKRDIFLDEKFLGTEVGRQFKFLAETSCMSKDGRKKLAYIQILLKLMEFEEKHGEDPEFKSFMEEFVKPSLELLGFADWERGELTDLSLRTALSTYPSAKPPEVGELKDEEDSGS